MAIHQPNDEQQTPNSFFLDNLYCEEEKWDDNELEQEHEEQDFSQFGAKKIASFFQVSLLEQELFWEDGELLSLFTKEQEIVQFQVDLDYSISRQEAVEWILKVTSRYGFTTLTSILAINYFDRFISCSCYRRDKPWMIQLVAVTCLSLAAKVEETQVPLLLDFQVEDCNYVFEAKTIQRMELLVLSALKWKMHPVTPLSFLDHIIRRLGLKTTLHWEFLKRCECLLLNIVSDSRSTRFVPSVLAAATMMHVIDQVEPFNPNDYQNQLLGIFKIDKEKVNDCYELICEVLKSRNSNGGNDDQMKSRKRKFEAIPSSPSGVIDANFSSDNSNESWAMCHESPFLPCDMLSPTSLHMAKAFASSSVSLSLQPLFKKNKTQYQRVFVDVVGIGNCSPH